MTHSHNILLLFLLLLLSSLTTLSANPPIEPEPDMQSRVVLGRERGVPWEQRDKGLRATFHRDSLPVLFRGFQFDHDIVGMVVDTNGGDFSIALAPNLHGCFHDSEETLFKFLILPFSSECVTDPPTEDFRLSTAVSSGTRRCWCVAIIREEWEQGRIGGHAGGIIY